MAQLVVKSIQHTLKQIWLKFLSVKSLIEKWVLVPFLCCFMVWVFIPSSVFLQPDSYHLSKSGLVTFSRQVPWGAVTADYYAEIMTADGFECHQGEWGEAEYQEAEETNGIVQYTIGNWALPCLTRGHPWAMSGKWVVHFPFIPFLKLRPVRRTYIIDDIPPGEHIPLEPR